MLKTNTLKNIEFKKVVKNFEIINSNESIHGEVSYFVKINNDSFLSGSSSFLKVALESNFYSEKEFVFLNKKYRIEKKSITHNLLENVLDYAKLNLPERITISENEYRISYSIYKRNASYNQDYSLFKITIFSLPSLLKNATSLNQFKQSCLEVFYNAFSVNYENICSILNQCLFGNIYFIKNTFEYFENDISLYKIENNLNFSKGLSNVYTLNSIINETPYTNLKVTPDHKGLVFSFFHDYFNKNIVNGRSIDRSYKYELFKQSLIFSFDDYSMFHNKLLFETEEILDDENPEYISTCFFVKGKISSDRFDSISKELILGNFSHGLMKFMSGLERI